MNEHSSRQHANDGLPRWLNITVVLTLLALFVYQVVIVGPKGYPTNVIIGGLLGAYAGVDQYVKRRKMLNDAEKRQSPTEVRDP